jgi:hypothetical protein
MDTGQARVELTCGQTSTDSWNSQAGKVSGIVRERNKTGLFKYVIQLVRNRNIFRYYYICKLRNSEIEGFIMYPMSDIITAKMLRVLIKNL